MMEIHFIRKADGAKVRSVAYYSYRCGPIGEWVIGNTPVDEFDEGEIVWKGPWAGGETPWGGRNACEKNNDGGN